MPKFTDRFLTNLALAPGQKDRLLFDAECPGLGVRLSASGTRVFLVQWTDKATGGKRRQPLGKWGSITIEQARTATRAILGDVARGGDPAVDRIRRKAEAAAEKAEAALTLAVLIDQWAERHLVARKARYAKEAPSALRRIFAEELARPASRLSRRQVMDKLDLMGGQGKIAMARQTVVYGRAAFGWAIKREKVKDNPFVGLPAIGAAVDRERTLSADEAREVWHAAGALPYPWGPFYALALLTLQRRDEVAGRLAHLHTNPASRSASTTSAARARVGWPAPASTPSPSTRSSPTSRRSCAASPACISATPTPTSGAEPWRRGPRW